MKELQEIESKNCHRMFILSKHNKHSQEYCTKVEANIAKKAVIRR